MGMLPELPLQATSRETFNAHNEVESLGRHRWERYSMPALGSQPIRAAAPLIARALALSTTIAPAHYGFLSRSHAGAAQARAYGALAKSERGERCHGQPAQAARYTSRAAYRPLSMRCEILRALGQLPMMKDDDVAMLYITPRSAQSDGRLLRCIHEFLDAYLFCADT